MKKPQEKSKAIKAAPAPQLSPVKNPAWLSGTILFAILLITFFIYKSSLSNQLLWWDDNKYVFENEAIKSLSLSNIWEMFTAPKLWDYTPLVHLSLAVDYALYGLHQLGPNTYSGEGFHTSSLVIHLLSVIVLYFFCLRLSRSQFVSAIVATLFAIHPMNVESVCWVTERKDQLYVLFFLSAMLSYLFYLEELKLKYLLLTGLFFLLSLFSKGMAVTLPIVLLLLDYFAQRKLNRRVIYEKIPLFLLSVFFGWLAITLQTQYAETHGTIIEHHNAEDRFLFASYGIINYITKSFVPFQMSAFYPFPEKTDGSYPAIFYLSLFIVAGLVWFFWKIRKNRTITFGILFFIVNILLVLQFVAFGSVLLADRFTYLSSIGLFFAGAITLNNYFKVQTLLKRFIVIIALPVYCIYLGSTTYKRTKVWKTTETLWKDVEKKFPANKTVAQLSSQVLARQGFMPDDFHKMNVSVDSSNASKYSRRAMLYYQAGKLDSSIMDLNLLLDWEKNNCNRAKIFEHRGKVFIKMGKKKEAISDLKTSFELSQGCQNFNYGELQKDVQSARALPD